MTVDRRLPGSVALAIRAAWGLVGVIALTVVLMAVFHDDVVGSWARRHEGAREAFEQGGRDGLARAGFVPPAFLPVGATMLVVAAMLVWVLTIFFREGHRWGQLGLTGLVAVSVFASVDLGLLLDPPRGVRGGRGGLAARRGGHGWSACGTPTRSATSPGPGSTDPWTARSTRPSDPFSTPVARPLVRVGGEV